MLTVKCGEILICQGWDVEWISTAVAAVDGIGIHMLLKLFIVKTAYIGHDSFHFVEDNPFEGNGCRCVVWILMFKSPTLLSEIQLTEEGVESSV